MILRFSRPSRTDELKATRKELEALKEGQTAIRKDLETIKNFLQARQAPGSPETQSAVVSLDDDPFKGDKNAKLTLIEFSDYQCPFCSRHFRETLPQLERDYIKAGKVKYVFRDFPIESIHREAFKASEAANCASEQGKYWEMHHRLFANQRALGLKDLPQHAQALGLDVATFQKCLDSGKEATEVRGDMADGQRVGVKGTPTFFLGVTEPGSNMLKAVKVLRGAQSYATFRAAIESLLSEQN